MTLRTDKDSSSLLEAAWLRHQVQTHLVFGPLSRRLSFGWVWLAVALLYGLSIFSARSWPVAVERAFVTALLVFLCRFYVQRMPRYRQAALGWWITKAVLALVSFLTLLIGGLVGFFRGQPDAAHLTLLALIWFPSLEFVPSLINHQRFITIGRILLSVPIAYLGAQAGRWTWTW